MKKTQIAALLALAGVGLLVPQAQAVTTYSSNGDDLFLGFRQDNNTTSDILIDLGQASIYRDHTTTGSLNSIIGTGLEGSTGLLATSFGSGWFTDPTVHWGLTGGSATTQTINSITETINTLYISNPETNTNPPTSQTSSTQGTAISAITTMKNQWVGLATSTGLNNGRVETPGSTTWSGEASNAFNDATQYGNFEDNPNAASAMDLYRVSRSSSPSAADGIKGTFTIDSTGQVFYAAPTPEPTTIALLGGAGMLLLARRRRTSAVA